VIALAVELPIDVANRVAAETYATLESEHSPAALQLEELIVALTADAMRSAGVPDGDERTGGGFDLAACELFADDATTKKQIHQEIVELIYRATLAYLQSMAGVLGAAS
jgi:hypothetical protein